MISSRLSTRFTIAVTVALVIVFAAELSLRAFFELPVLRELEYKSDQKSVERGKRAVQARVTALEEEVLDYAVWDETYEFMASDKSSTPARYFVDSEIGLSALEINDINGVAIVDRVGRVVHHAYYDLETAGSPPWLALDLGSLQVRRLAALLDVSAGQVIDSGIVNSNIGSVMFAASKIQDTDSTLTPRGVFIFWRLMDRKVLDHIRRVVGADLRFIPIREARSDPGQARKVRELENDQANFGPRDASGSVYWLIHDKAGEPLYLVQQDPGPRSFNSSLLSLSSGIGFAVMALVLLFIATYFTRSVIRRVQDATATMRQVWRTGDYSSRIAVRGNDEIAEMSALFNEMLKTVEVQEQELKEQNRQLSEISLQDPLTGIANRRHLNEVFDRSWRQAARSSRPISILMIDVDHFKPFNDHYGHQAGDRVLKQVAQALQENLHRATDFVSRYGGEEFCVILSDTNVDDAVRVAETLRRAIRSLRIRHDRSDAGVITVSIGVASTMPEARVIHLDLVKQADQALYAAKAAGRDRVVRHGDADSRGADRTGS